MVHVIDLSAVGKMTAAGGGWHMLKKEEWEGGTITWWRK